MTLTDISPMRGAGYSGLSLYPADRQYFTTAVSLFRFHDLTCIMISFINLILQKLFTVPDRNLCWASLRNWNLQQRPFQLMSHINLPPVWCVYFQHEHDRLLAVLVGLEVVYHVTYCSCQVSYMSVSIDLYQGCPCE